MHRDELIAHLLGEAHPEHARPGDAEFWPIAESNLIRLGWPDERIDAVRALRGGRTRSVVLRVVVPALSLALLAVYSENLIPIEVASASVRAVCGLLFGLMLAVPREQERWRAAIALKDSAAQKSVAANTA
ncbi:MAG: hypothetical protein AAF430_18490 [Myxococcota bacterium]